MNTRYAGNLKKERAELQAAKLDGRNDGPVGVMDDPQYRSDKVLEMQASCSIVAAPDARGRRFDELRLAQIDRFQFFARDEIIPADGEFTER